MMELEIVQQKILRKILGPIKGKEQYKLYLHIGKVTDTIRKRRVTFCEHF